MFVIRKTQLDALAGALDEAFAQRLADKMRRFWPRTCEAMGPAQLEARIAHGLERARAHGAREEVDIQRYLNLMFLLGDDFDTDSSLPWARAYLTAPGPISARLSQLCEYALAEARRSNGDAP
ncbi:hypothetical protein JY651_27645 [Pyxidicoccus parkwayensis]|uniref:Uncharacterized protein n=1 Tax=Pyxidicoccus parkwayensis TaxID=2813578 RepID=A0ABX7NJV8_9BACT|nr:hypothetical protein [Pyxidicoccus parkwaysis]QSQ19121.1 hypothetical protein JY651_27645 [Pyxidicoccus parkwaysis]